MSTLLLAITLTAAAPQFEANTLAGETVVGPIVKLDAQQVTIQSADGPVSLEIATLVDLSPKEAPEPADPPPDQPAVWVELVDGSLLLARGYTVKDARARIELSDGLAVDVPTAGIAHIRFQSQSDKVAAEWSRILGLKPSNDLLVVSKGESVDYHKGMLHDVTDTVIHFDFDGEALPIKRSKVHGLRYYHAPNGALPEAVCRITDVAGSEWSADSVSLSDDLQSTTLQWTTPTGVKVARPLAQVTRMDFSRGKIIYLSNLKPESVEYTPYFGTAKGLPSLAKLFAPRNDKNLEAGPLQVDGTQYAKGLALHSRTKIVYRLPGRFSRFKAVAGIDDGVRPRGNVQLVIRGDGRVLLDVAVTGADPPLPIDLDVTNVRRLSILVDFGDKLDVADHLDLCEARIKK